MNKISIIIPVYKVEKYLDKCLESIVNQTYRNIEIIVVDDGSPDNCPTICDSWASKDDRIIVLHKPNGGLSDARNYGIDKATGDFLMFVDSDDYVSTTICQKLLKLINKYNSDFSMCSTAEFDEDNIPSLLDQTFEEVVYTGNQIFEQLFAYKKYIMTAWAKLYKKELFQTIKYPKDKLHEDEFIIHEILNHTSSFAYTSEPLYYYLQRNNSIMGKKNIKNYEDIFEAYKNRYQYIQIYKPELSYQNNLHYLNNLRGLYFNCDNKYKELKSLIKAEHKKVYIHTKTFKDFIFTNFTWLYSMLNKIKK